MSADKAVRPVPLDPPARREDGISGIDPTKITVRTITSDEDRIVPWKVETHHSWVPVWSAEQKAGLRRGLGYYFVYAENVVEHYNELKRDEVRISTKGWITDGAGRVMNPDRQLLMLCPKHIYEERRIAKGERARRELVEKIAGHPAEEQPHLATVKGALERVEKGTYLTGDTDEVG